MPECRQCGNRQYFQHTVSGEQIREYDVAGNLIGTDHDSTSTISVACANCGSSQIDWQKPIDQNGDSDEQA